MAIDAGRLKHLEIIQQVITRMASNSFLLKGWSVTLLAAILAIAVKDKIYTMILIGYLPCIMFWMLDGYFLRQEKLFRKLWDLRRVENHELSTDFNMDTSIVAKEVTSWFRVCFSKTLIIFHGTLLVLLSLIVIFTSYEIITDPLNKTVSLPCSQSSQTTK